MKACNACSQTRTCIQDDDMTAIVEKMKAFIDRWYAVSREVFSGKRIILAVSSNGNETYQELIVEMFSEIIEYLDMEKYSILQAAGTNSKTSTRNNYALMEAAHTAGFDAVKTLP